MDVTEQAYAQIHILRARLCSISRQIEENPEITEKRIALELELIKVMAELDELRDKLNTIPEKPEYQAMALCE